MDNMFLFLVLGALAAVAGSLFIGLFYMTREGAEARQKSLAMMKWRVWLQGAAVALMLLAFLLYGN